MKKVALLFGSFNPVHIGHLVLANYMAAYAPIDEVWLVVSPHNPLKNRDDLLDSSHRYNMVELALAPLSLPIKTCDVELNLPQPSYTVDTLLALDNIYPNHKWTIAMGADNLENIEHWKSYQTVLQSYSILAYPRPGFNLTALCQRYGASELNAPLMEISSTFIRKAFAEGRNVDAFMPPGVADYIRTNKLSFR